MKTRLLFAAAFMAGAAFLAASPAMADETFDGPINTGPTQAPNTWYTDRYAPAGFQSGVAFAGRQTLEVTISDTDGALDRSPAFSSAFYNTQGRKLDLDPGTGFMSIEVFATEDWATSNRRMAGFWGTAFDDANNLTAYTILEFTSEGGSGTFRAYDSNDGSWTNLGLPGGFAYNSWTTLSVGLSGGNWIYKVNELSTSVDANGSTYIGNTILQAHNTEAGVNYKVHWDNLTASAAVPEPGTWALMITGFGMAGAMLRRRRSAGALA